MDHSSKVIRTAIDIIEEKGWVQHYGGDMEHGFCILGAVETIFPTYGRTSATEWKALIEVIEEQYPDRCQGVRMNPLNITLFNDHPDTTKAEVLAVMEKAAIKLEEQQSLG